MYIICLCMYMCVCVCVCVRVCKGVRLRVIWQLIQNKKETLTQVAQGDCCDDPPTNGVSFCDAPGSSSPVAS